MVVGVVGSVDMQGLVFMLDPILEGFNFYQLGFSTAERHLIVHKAELDGVLERGVEDHLDLTTFHETHLHDTFAKRAMA